VEKIRENGEKDFGGEIKNLPEREVFIEYSVRIRGEGKYLISSVWFFCIHLMILTDIKLQKDDRVQNHFYQEWYFFIVSLVLGKQNRYEKNNLIIIATHRNQYSYSVLNERKNVSYSHLQGYIFHLENLYSDTLFHEL